MNYDRLQDLYAAFDPLSVEGGWHRRQPALWPQPARNFLPHGWHYAQVKPILDAAGVLVDHSMAERRNLTMTNPVEGNRYATVRTMVAAYQSIKPGETAKAHRHTPSALRVILEGCGTSTVVDGTRVEMRPGDVLLTPNWAWHSHASTGTEDCYWVDILDVPLIHLLEPMFYERHPQGLEPDPVDAEASPIAFRDEDTRAALDRAPACAHGMAEREVQLGNPALRSIALHRQRLSAGFTSPVCRTTANSLFVVLGGRGRTIIDDQIIEWRFGDVVAVPCWRPYRHEADETAHLLRASDEPLMQALDLWRTEYA